MFCPQSDLGRLLLLISCWEAGIFAFQIGSAPWYLDLPCMRARRLGQECPLPIGGRDGARSAGVKLPCNRPAHPCRRAGRLGYCLPSGCVPQVPVPVPLLRDGHNCRRGVRARAGRHRPLGGLRAGCQVSDSPLGSIVYLTMESRYLTESLMVSHYSGGGVRAGSRLGDQSLIS